MGPVRNAAKSRYGARRLSRLGALVFAFAVLLSAGMARAQAPAPEQALRVAVKEVPPFAERSPEGEWAGTSIALWRDVARALELDYVFVEASLDEMIAGTSEGRYDVAVAALTVTAERERIVDFTHPFHTTGLAIAVPESAGQLSLRGLRETVFSPAFLVLIGALATIQLMVGTLVWVIERRANPEQFPAEAGPGVAAGFWWATVTMTTVGYGDKAPKTGLGRAVALIWMLAAMIILASVTASIASSLTIERLDARIRGPEDLRRFRVGVIAETTGASYLREHDIVAVPFARSEAALEALDRGEIDALVWDEPLLRGTLDSRPELDARLVPGMFQRQDYAIAVGEGSPLRESINRVLPELTRGRRFDTPSP